MDWQFAQLRDQSWSEVLCADAGPPGDQYDLDSRSCQCLSNRFGVVCQELHRLDLSSVSFNESKKHVRIGVVNLIGAARLSCGNQLISGQKNSNAWTLNDRKCFDAERCGNSNILWTKSPRGGKDGLSSCDIFTHSSHILSERDRLSDFDSARRFPGILDRNHRICACWKWCPCHDPDATALLDSDASGPTGKALADHRELSRAVIANTGGFVRAYRETIHGGSNELWDVHRGHESFGENSTSTGRHMAKHRRKRERGSVNPSVCQFDGCALRKPPHTDIKGRFGHVTTGGGGGRLCSTA
jgi:hypothetical protein